MAPVVLVRGDRVLAEPMAARLAAALGELWGVAPHTQREVESLAALTADLRTFSLFEPGKILVVQQSGVLADREAAEPLVAELRKMLPVEAAGELAGAARNAALRLLQILRLHDVDPAAGAPERALGALPDGLLSEGKGKGAAEELRRQLAPLLSAALAAGLHGTGEEEASLVADLLRDGLPQRHLLILVESAVAGGHPVVEALERRHSVLDAGRLGSEGRGRYSGLDALKESLERETGVRLRLDAEKELARRTLRLEDSYRSGRGAGIDENSATRFAAEYRKLATLAGAGGIDAALVRENVEDRGEEEVWPILDALGEGKADLALAKIRRRVAGAEDPLVERLVVFGTLAKFSRQLVLMAGLTEISGVKKGVDLFPRFRDDVFPRLAEAAKSLSPNPLVGQKPYPWHRAYLSAPGYSNARLARLPALALEAERRIKGDSSDPDSALLAFALALVASAASRPKLRGG